MKIELLNNKVFLNNQGSKKEIHPFWLRERVNGETYVDKSSQQRLFDPTKLTGDIKIKNLNLSDSYLEVTFSDGVSTRLETKNIIREFSNINDIKHIDKVQWDATLQTLNNYLGLSFALQVFLNDQ